MTFGQASASTQMLAAATVKISSSFHQYTGLRLASESLSRRGTRSEQKLIYAAFAVREFCDALLRTSFWLFTLVSIGASWMPWFRRQMRMHGSPVSCSRVRQGLQPHSCIERVNVSFAGPNMLVHTIEIPKIACGGL